MNTTQLQAFRDIALAMQTQPADWQWIGPHMSQRMFGITRSRRRIREGAWWSGTADESLLTFGPRTERIVIMFNNHDDEMYEQFAQSDYMREAYGDPCPTCRTLRWQADCPKCMNEMYDLQYLQDRLDTIASEPGSLVVTKEERKDTMLFFAARGWKVRCVGATVIWEKK